MQVFINESSLHSQYENNFEFVTALRIFVKSMNVLVQLQKEKEIFNSSAFFYSFGLNGIMLGTALKSSPDVNNLFLLNWQTIKPKNWHESQLHDIYSSYEFNKKNYVTYSSAEITERKIQDNKILAFLLNFEKSEFGEDKNIEFNKNNTEKVLIDCVIDESDIAEWLIENKVINPDEEYDETSKIVPLDCQTVLRDNKIFEKTNLPKNNGRRVYRKKDNGQLWVVDSSSRHAGKGAHIEVFDGTTRRHLGTSLYNQINLNTSFKKTDRTL